MLACLGFAAQHAATGASPLEALGAHLANPFVANFATKCDPFCAFLVLFGCCVTRRCSAVGCGPAAAVPAACTRRLTRSAAHTTTPSLCSAACPCPWRKRVAQAPSAGGAAGGSGSRGRGRRLAAHSARRPPRLPLLARGVYCPLLRSVPALIATPPLTANEKIQTNPVARTTLRA